MEKHRVAIILFYDDKGNIIMQERPKEKVGHKYGFFGGHIEKEETPEQALIREIKEEMGIILKDYQFFRFYHHISKEFNRDVEKSVFISTIPSEKLTINEGKAFFTDFKRVIEQDFSNYDKEIINYIKKYLK